MTYDYFADKHDKLDILEFIFKETDLQVYDLSSPYSGEICEYKNVNEIASKFDLKNGDEYFQLWSPRHKGKPLFRKVNLDPRRCKGHTFRYSTEGWGLIQLYFAGIKSDVLKDNALYRSHVGHQSEKRALAWEDTETIYGNVSKWNWTEIQKTSRKINYLAAKLSRY